MHWNRMRSFSPRATYGSPSELFGRFLGHGLGSAPSFPAFNIWSNDDGAIVTSELPGVKLEDIEITAQGKTINVKGTRKEELEENTGYLRHERPDGEFNRTIELPFQIDTSGVDAKLVNGVLTVRLPRAENDKPRKIAVNVN